MHSPTYDKQASLLARYLIGKSVSDSKVVELYEAAVTRDQSQAEEKLVQFAFKHPWLIPSLDAALVFVRPHSELRRRIYIMFAVLESMPQFADLFLPRKFRFTDVVALVFTGFRAVCRAIVGFILMKVCRL